MTHPPPTSTKVRFTTRAHATLAALLLLSAVSAAPADEPGSGDATAEREAQQYELLIERNIFSPTRGQRPAAPPREQTSERAPQRAVAPPDPGRDVVLRGVGRRGDTAIALIEDEDETLHRVSVGDTVAGRRMIAITLDAVEFEHQGQRRTITTGMTLTGETAAAPQRPAAGDSGNSNSSNAAGRPDAQRLLEQMRQRRAQRLGGERDSPAQAPPEPPSEPEPEPDALPAPDPRDEDRAFDGAGEEAPLADGVTPLDDNGSADEPAGDAVDGESFDLPASGEDDFTDPADPADPDAQDAGDDAETAPAESAADDEPGAGEASDDWGDFDAPPDADNDADEEDDEP